MNITRSDLSWSERHNWRWMSKRLSMAGRHTPCARWLSESNGIDLFLRRKLQNCAHISVLARGAHGVRRPTLRKEHFPPQIRTVSPIVGAWEEEG